MYLRKAKIEHIKGLSKVEMAFEEGKEAGWHVILGDNGSGKTTLIRALALGFMGPDNAIALREDWSRWVVPGSQPNQNQIALVIEGFDEENLSTGRVRAALKLWSTPSVNNKERIELVHVRSAAAKLTVWRLSGFSASFGPARRFTGGNEEYQKIFRANPWAARHISAFSEQVALSEAFIWLKDQRELFEPIKRFFNETMLLPHEVKLESIDEDGMLHFRDGNGVPVDAAGLADGYRSILSLALELLRLMAEAFGWSRIFDRKAGTVQIPGVVLIDEVDVHLHPSWQESVGEWFKARFPKVQFIVATHSPLVCRAIGEHGKVFRLRAPGGEGPQLMEITGVERDILWYGSLHKALSSPAFGLSVARSPFSVQRLEELGRLNRAVYERELTPEEEDQRAHLQAVLSDDRRILGQG